METKCKCFHLLDTKWQQTWSCFFELKILILSQQGETLSDKLLWAYFNFVLLLEPMALLWFGSPLRALRRRSPWWGAGLMSSCELSLICSRHSQHQRVYALDEQGGRMALCSAWSLPQVHLHTHILHQLTLRHLVPQKRSEDWLYSRAVLGHEPARSCQHQSQAPSRRSGNPSLKEKWSVFYIMSRTHHATEEQVLHHRISELHSATGAWSLDQPPAQ